MSFRRTIGFLLIIIVLVLIGRTSIFHRVITPLERVMIPVESGFHGVARFFGLTGRGSAVDVSEQLAELQSQVSTLGVDRANLATLQAENAQLKTIIALRDSTGWRLAAARVIGQDPSDPSHRFRLSAGLQDGVVTGSAVVGPSGALLGLVINAGDTTSVVQLLKAPGVEIPARLQNAANAFGALKSEDGLSLRFTEVPKEATLVLGDVVVANTGLAGVPPNIPIGSIVAAANRPDALWQEALVGAFADPATADVVAIILPTK